MISILHTKDKTGSFYKQRLFNWQSSYCESMGMPQSPLFQLTHPRSLKRTTTVRRHLQNNTRWSYYQPARYASKIANYWNGQEINVIFMTHNGHSNAFSSVLINHQYHICHLSSPFTYKSYSNSHCKSWHLMTYEVIHKLLLWRRIDVLKKCGCLFFSVDEGG